MKTLKQSILINLTILAVVNLSNWAYFERYICVNCGGSFDIEELLDSGGGVCSYCASSRIYGINEDCDLKENYDKENLFYGWD